MQLAHPLVAAGVAAHSDFLERPVERLDRTMRLTLAMVFGTPEEAREAARAVNHTHERVTGELPEATPRLPRGTPYRASDPELLLWVHSTLVDSALVAYETFIAPLTAAERDAYWRESWVLGRMLGIPAATFPPRIEDFDEYVRATVARLHATDGARQLASAVLRPPLRRVPAPVFWPHEIVTVGLLPERLRDQFGLAWSPRHAAAYRAVVASLRGVVRVSPSWLRRAYPARMALPRWRQS